MNNVHFSSATDNWATPQDFFDELNEEFQFELDVCADEYNHKCPIWLNKEVDGLDQSWHTLANRCWMNPPYGREIGKWIKKAYEESQMGTIVVCLIPARTDTTYFHDYILGKAEIRFIRGRLKFGDAKNAAPFPSMVVVYKPPKRRYFTY